MTKKILTRDIPEQVFTEQIGGIYPTSIHVQDDGKEIVGADVTIPRLLFNTSTNTTEMQRTSNIIKHSGNISAAGQTALWTPATGKRIRLIGFSVVVNPATTTAAGSLVTVQQGSTDLDNVIYLGAAALAVPARWAGFVSGNGILFSPNEVLNVNLSAACTAGGIYMNAWGTEE